MTQLPAATFLSCWVLNIVPEEEPSDQRVREMTAAIAAGSEEAFRDFFDLYYERLRRLVLWQTRGDEALTRDILQGVLVRAARYLTPFHEERKLWAWLRQLARSAHVDWLRRNRGGDHFAPIQMLEHTAQPIDASEADEELFAALEGSLNSLPSDERDLIQLAYFSDLTQREIADKIHTTPKAVESKLARIRARLRKQMLQNLNDHALT